MVEWLSSMVSNYTPFHQLPGEQYTLFSQTEDTRDKIGKNSYISMGTENKDGTQHWTDDGGSSASTPCPSLCSSSSSCPSESDTSEDDYEHYLQLKDLYDRNPTGN